MIYLELFWSFVQIGLFSIGGGYAAMPLIQAQVVDKHGWISESVFLDIITIAEMTPGPIAVNSASFVGQHVGGFLGAIVATLGCVLPSFIIVLMLAYVYYRFRGLTTVQGILQGLRPAVVAMIASAGLTLLTTALYGSKVFAGNWLSFDLIALILLVVALFVLRKWKPNPMYVMAGCGAVGAVLYALEPYITQLIQ